MDLPGAFYARPRPSCNRHGRLAADPHVSAPTGHT